MLAVQLLCCHPAATRPADTHPPACPPACSNVNDNQLTGNMPDSWAVGPAFLSLADLQMAGNRFSGTFPAGFAVTNTSFISVMSL